MSIAIKDTTKRDLKIKNCNIIDGKFFNDGIETDLIDILNKIYPDDYTFDISAVTKSEEDIEIEDEINTK